YRTPLNGRNFEYMGEDPLLASKMVVPYIKGVQENGVAACVKHYVLNNQELWRDHINVEVGERALREIYLPAFKAAVLEGEVWSVMGSYNKFRGQFCSHHEYLINGILKGEWEFDGVVVTDWGSAHNTVEAALYGLDMEMGTGTDGLTTTLSNAYDNYYLAAPFLEKLKSGEIPESVLDDKVRRILRLMYRTSMSPDRGFGRMNNKEHLEVARKIGVEGIVLLKNDDNFFPMDPATSETIAVIGENATRSMTLGGGSSELKAKIEISPLQGIRDAFPKASILHATGYASGPSVYGRVEPSSLDADSLRQEAVTAASKADRVIFVGGLNKNHLQDCEGGDRESMNLPFGQDELLKEILEVNPNVGVVLVSGNAVAMPWLSEVDAVVQAWYLGSMAGHALADVLSGKVSPSGKLPISFPVRLQDNAAHSFGPEAYPGDSVDVIYREDILVGYRWHDTRGVKPLYPFGYGLSYTDFAIANIGTDQAEYTLQDMVRVSFQLRNTGAYRGAEVIQVYVGKPDSEIPRASKELRGFKKLWLDAGAMAEGTIDIPVESFQYYDEAGSQWSLEPGEYVLYIGNSSDNIWKEVTVSVSP
ncbi:MAG: glycoside hydrolase family 3 C-terminal domain-containing protein, partial [Robiginitalea sp.]